MNINIKQAERYEKAANELLKMAANIRAGIDPNQCANGEDTGEAVKTGACKTCGNPTWIKCKNKKVVADRVNSNVCKTCKHRTVISNQLSVTSYQLTVKKYK